MPNTDHAPITDYDELFNICCIAEDIQRQQRIIPHVEAVKYFLKDEIKAKANDKDLGVYIRATYG